MSRTYALISALFLSFISTPSFSEELNFLFSVDQNVKSEDIRTKIDPKKDISSNNWFATPPTRLELFTFSLDQYFQKQFEQERDWYYSKIVEEYFEKGELGSPMEYARASYSREEDIFVLGVEITTQCIK